MMINYLKMPKWHQRSSAWMRLLMVIALSVIYSSKECVAKSTSSSTVDFFHKLEAKDKSLQLVASKRHLAESSPCQDEPGFTFKNVNNGLVTCKWLVAEVLNINDRRKTWCDGSPSTLNDGVVIANKCKASCGDCDNGCKDNEYFKFTVGENNKQVGCEWITDPSLTELKTANRIVNRCDANKPNRFVGDHCRKTCGLCDEVKDVLLTTEPRITPPSSPVLPPVASPLSEDNSRVGTVETNVDGNGWIDISQVDALSSLSGSNEGDRCGLALDISKSGKFLIMGCPGSNNATGSVRLFEFTSSGWSGINIGSEAPELPLGNGIAVSIVENEKEGAIYFAIASIRAIQVWRMTQTSPAPKKVGIPFDIADFAPLPDIMQLAAGGKILTFIEESETNEEVTFNQKRLLGSSHDDYKWVDDIEPFTFTFDQRIRFKVTADGKQLAIHSQSNGFRVIEFSGKMDSRDKRTRKQLTFSNLPETRQFTGFDLSDDGKTLAFGDNNASSDGKTSNGAVHVFNIVRTSASSLTLEPVSPKRITGEMNNDFCGGFVKVFNEDRISVIYTCATRRDGFYSLRRAILIGDEVTTWRKDQLSISEDFTRRAFSSNFRFALGNPSEDENKGVVKVFQDKIQTPSDVVLLNDDWREITTGKGIFGTEANDICGTGLDMSKSGRFVLVGCPTFTEPFRGSVHLFEFIPIGDVLGDALTWRQRSLGIAASPDGIRGYGHKVSMVENKAEDNLYFAVCSADADPRNERIDVWRMPMNSFGIKRVGEPIIIERTANRLISNLQLSAGGRILTFSHGFVNDDFVVSGFISIERRRLIGNCNTLCEWRDDMNRIETNMRRATFSVSVSGKRLAHLSSEGLKLLQFDENVKSTPLLDKSTANMFGGFGFEESSVSLSDDGKTIALGEALFSSGGMTENGRVRVFNVIKSETTGKVGLEEVGRSIIGRIDDGRCGNNVKVFNDNHITVYFSCRQENKSTKISRATLTGGLNSQWSFDNFVIPKLDNGGDRDFTLGNREVLFAANAFRLAIGNPKEDVEGNEDAGLVRVFQNDKLFVELPETIISAPTSSPPSTSKGGKGKGGKKGEAKKGKGGKKGKGKKSCKKGKKGSKSSTSNSKKSSSSKKGKKGSSQCKEECDEFPGSAKSINVSFAVKGKKIEKDNLNLSICKKKKKSRVLSLIRSKSEIIGMKVTTLEKVSSTACEKDCEFKVEAEVFYKGEKPSNDENKEFLESKLPSDVKLKGDVTSRSTVSAAAAQYSDQPTSNNAIIYSAIAVSIVVSLVAIGFLLYRHGLNKGQRDVSNQEYVVHKSNSNLDATVDLSFFQDLDSPVKAKTNATRSTPGSSSLKSSGSRVSYQANQGGNNVTFPVQESKVMYAEDMNDEMSQAFSEFISVSKHPASVKVRNRTGGRKIETTSHCPSQTRQNTSIASSNQLKYDYVDGKDDGNSHSWEDMAFEGTSQY